MPAQQNPQLIEALDPNFNPTQLTKAQRQQRIGEMLMQQGMGDQLQGQMVSGRYVAPSWTQGLSKLLSTGLGAYMGNKGETAANQIQTQAIRNGLASILQGNTTTIPGADQIALSAGASGNNPITPSQVADQQGIPPEMQPPSMSNNSGPTQANLQFSQALQQGQGMPAQSTQIRGQGPLGNIPQNVAAPILTGLVPDSLGKAMLDQYKQADIVSQIRAAGIDPQSPLGQQLAQQSLAKANYIAPVSGRPGGTMIYPDGRMVQNPSAIDGAQAVMGPNGQWTYRPMAGALPAMQNAATVETLGKTMGTLNQGVDAQGNPTYFMGIPPGIGAQGTQNSLSPTQSWIGPEPTGAFVGDPNQIASSISRISDPTERSAAMRALQNQMGGKQEIPPSDSTIRPANPPGFNEFQKTTAEAAGKRINDLVSQAQDSPTRINVLDNILTLSKSGVATGPTAEWKNQAKGIAADSLGIKSWQNDVSGFQEMKKFLLQNGQRAWSSAGGTGTDTQLEAAMHANPNDTMFPQAIQTMANWAKSGELALQGKANAYQTSGINDPKGQAQFEATWRQNMDPRLYQMKLMSPQEAQSYVANLKQANPSDYAGLIRKAQVLKQMGGL